MVVGRVETPRPLHRAGAEHQRAARLPVQRELCVAVPAPYVIRCRAGVSGTFTRRGRQVISRPGGTVVEVFVPFVSERAGGERVVVPGAASRRRCSARTAVGRPSAGTCDRVRAAVDREHRAGQRVLGPAAVAGRAEPRVAPRAGPHVRRRVDLRVGVRFLVRHQRAVGGARCRRCSVSQRVFQNTSLPLKNARFTPASRAASTLRALLARPVLVVADRQEHLVRRACGAAAVGVDAGRCS